MDSSDSSGRGEQFSVALARVLIRYDRNATIHEAFLALGCCLVCFKRLQRSL